MIYKNFQNLKLSALGFGTMRLPTIDGDDGNIDQARVEEMVACAIKKGINYFDTAWGYHNGMSETAIGKALSAYPRESFYLASKFPGYDLSNMTKVKEIFEKQLQKCGVEYFDFYMFHNVCEANIDSYLDEKYGIFDYLTEQKRLGRIKHLGFSGHGSTDVLRRFLEKYGHAMEFGQLQINWIDWEFQNGRGKYELLREWNIPVWVMEPLRGGRLCRLSEEDEAKLRALRPDETVTSWAFRFLQSLPEVTMVLSGMSSNEQMMQNTATYETEAPLSEEELRTLLGIAKCMTSQIALPCTACRYCTEYCPQGLDIPMLLELYNEHAFTGGGFLAPMALSAVDESKRPAACIGCKACEQVCPQNIKISEAMSKFCKMLK